MSRKSKYISLLQVSERGIIWARARHSSRGVDLVRFDQVTGDWDSEGEEMARVLREFTQKHGIAEDDVYTVLPRHAMTARILELPSHDPAEIESMVRLSAEEFVPYRGDELVMGQSILEKRDDGVARVLVVLAHRDVVDSHIDALAKAHLEPARVFVSTACLASAGIAASRDPDERACIVNLASGGLEAVVIHGTRMEYGRGIAVQHDWEPADGATADVLEELTLEIRASLAAYQRESEDGAGIDAVYLTSDTVNPESLAEGLSGGTGLVCQPAPFEQQLLVQPRAASAQPVPLTLLGAALAAQGRARVVVDLTPQSLLKARERRGLRRAVLTMAGVAALAVLSLVSLYALKVHERRAHIRQLDEVARSMAPRAEGIIEKRKQLNILRQQVDRSNSPLELLAAISELAPASGFNITQFRFDRGELIRVEGRAKSRGEVNAFMQALLDAGKSSMPLFAQARQAYTQDIYERNERIVQYSISIPFDEDGTEEVFGLD